MALNSGIPQEDFQKMLPLIQSFYPPGVGARDLRECLLIQLQREGKENSLEYKIVSENMEDLGKRRFPEIARHIGTDVEEVQKAANRIARLNPRPGQVFAAAPQNYVLPDVTVEKVDGEYQVILNSSDRLASVDAGSSAFSNLGRSSVIPAMARGDTNFFYFYNFDDSPGIEGCWARPGIAAIKDLRGRKVAANTSAEITLSGLLAMQGMTEKDVDYLNLGPTDMAPALAKGDIEAACVWQPLLDDLKKAAPDGKLFYAANDDGGFLQLWKSDGTATGTVEVKKINPKTQSADVGSTFGHIGNTIFFAADDGIHGAELWKSDGTAAGTVMVKDINPGPGRSLPEFGFTIASRYFSVGPIEGALYFSANDGVHGRELWKTEGTAAGTVMVADINSGSSPSYPTYFNEVKGKILLRGSLQKPVLPECS